MIHTVKHIINTATLDMLDIKALLRHVLSLTRAQLITQADRVLNDIEYNLLQEFIAKRSLGIPLAYLLQYKEFYSREFVVTKHTLIPRPETELLVDYVSGLVQQLSININTLKTPNQRSTPNMSTSKTKTGLRLLDLGTGSGCIAITCKLECAVLEVVATDISPEALAVATENAKRLNADVDFRLSNWYTELDLVTDSDKFNIIVSNPPYIAVDDVHLANLQYEPQGALTDNADGLSAITSIICGASDYLLNNGCLIVEHGYNQGQDVSRLFKQYGFENFTTLVYYSGLDRITTGVLI
jgi:release factor glutamine methyltransferase